MKKNDAIPGPQGLYHPEQEHDACGVGFVVHLKGERSHEIIENGLQVLENMKHRGAEGADNKSGDGAGLMTQIPHEFILLQGVPVPERGKYGTGLVFLPRDEKRQQQILDIIRRYTEAENLTLMHVRKVPVNQNILGESARATEPVIRQLFITGSEHDTLERKLYLVRKRIEKECLSLFGNSRTCYIPSLSSRRIVYKGMLTSLQLRHYFKDLTNPYYTSALALVHSRFSTNTFPTWDLAQPFRLLGHNGEINTITGNRSWMAAREPLLNSPNLGKITDISPIIQPGMSDSASLDNALEFFLMSGMSLPHALSMLIPESFNEKNPLSHELQNFYAYHSILMEPWDGPAALLFSDGRYIGGMLDRNGLRPARYLITHNDMMVAASETGVLDIDPANIREKGRFRPGKMILVDTQCGRLYYDADIKSALATAHPYQEWVENNCVSLGKLKSGRKVPHVVEEYEKMLQLFGYTREDIENIIQPMVINQNEPTGSMGCDLPLAVLSSRPQGLFNYFRQKFAQVTNPPIDPIREELVMSLTDYIGAMETNLLTPAAEHCKVVRLTTPIITNTELDILCHLQYKGFHTVKLPILFPADQGARGLEQAMDQLCQAAEQAVDQGCNYIILSDRDVSREKAPIPSLLALSAIHHHLLEKRKRAQIALIVESAEPREIFHIALLIGFGASAVCPYLVFGILKDLVIKGKIQLDYEAAKQHYFKALNKGLLKIMSKSGISTLRSYRGAKMFESIGISQHLLDKYFKGMTSPIGGIELPDLVKDTLENFRKAHDPVQRELLENAGYDLWRKGGELHAWHPELIRLLQQAVRRNDYEKYKQFSHLADRPEHPVFLRHLLKIKHNPIPIEQVEPTEEIMKRFVAGAMSFGAISQEAHETIAIAMNRIGSTSNTGEGGEDPLRNRPRTDGKSTRSAVKQIASGRFGVNAEYLVHADEIQIKVAQGAKPGEGGQLPGFKVDEMIARTRHSLPGISLISPPPHHDIYSIEDLAQLIYDLKNINPTARISVKLVSESGIGTIAAGVAKAKADSIVISGADGGTGASPKSSIKYAGLPFETGLAEVQQTLLLNGLRANVRLQNDGQLKTGHDIIISALLGSEEYGFGTTLLVILGCVMDRRCHLNTCPVGIATQNPDLRKHFQGKDDYLICYFRMLAEEVREYLAAMGFTRMSDIIGRTDLIEPVNGTGLSKAARLDFGKLLWRPAAAKEQTVSTPPFPAENSKYETLIKKIQSAVEKGKTIDLSAPIHSTDRSTGTKLSGWITRKYGSSGLPDNTLSITFHGSAGQSFGAFLVQGVTFRLEGDANDYLGKGLSGGKIAVCPPEGTSFIPAENTIAGNTLLYGATAGEVYINGRVGERFCVRNSGAIAVAEGVGDHGCEYMTGGRVVVLGPVGRNFAAGMSGGIAYVWNCNGNFDYFCNMEMVELTLVEETKDREELHRLLTAHLRYTGSPLATQLLSDWDNSCQQFLKVIPVEYKKALQPE